MGRPDEALALGIRYRDAFFARDIDAIMALVTPDFVFHNVTGGERIEGAEAARAHISAIFERWPDMRFEEPEGSLRAGDDHMTAEWTARATHPTTGKVVEWDGMDLIVIRDGRVSRNAMYSSAHAARVLDAPG